MSSNPQQEKKETPTGAKETLPGIQALKDAASRLFEGDKNLSHTEKLVELKGDETPAKQIESITYLQSRLINILAKLKRSNEKIDLGKINPENIGQTLGGYGVPLDLSERAAIDTTERLLREGGPTADYIRSSWRGMVTQGNQASEGFGQKYLASLKKKPVETLVYTAAGAAGIYLGYKIIKWLAGKAWNKTKEKVSSVFSVGNVLAVLGLGTLGAYIGRDGLQKWIKEHFGIEMVKEKLDGLVEKIKQGVIPDEIKQMAEKIKQGGLFDEQEIKRRLGDKPIPEPVKQILKRDGYISGNKFTELTGIATGGIAIAAARAAEKVKTGAKQIKAGAEKVVEDRAKYQQYAEMIEGTSPDFSIHEELLPVIGNQKYEDFIKNNESFVDTITQTIQQASKIPPAETLKKLAGLGIGDLRAFFITMLKNNGELEEFKGKTIGQVLEMIYDNQTKYINEEVVKEAQKTYKAYVELSKMWPWLKENIPKLSNKGYWSDLFQKLGAAGVTLAIDKSENGVVWAFKNGIPIMKFTGSGMFDVVKGIADYALESDNYMWKAVGTYLHIGKYTVAIGAPLGAAYGVITGGGKYGWVTGNITGGVRGLFKGIGRGAMMPARGMMKAAKILCWELPPWWGDRFSPLDDVKFLYDKHISSFLDDLSTGPLRNTLKAKAFSTKVLNGEVDIDERTMKKLNNLAANANEEAESLRKTTRKGGERRMRYIKIEKDIDKINELMEWDPKEMKFNLFTENSEIFKKMKGIDITQELIDIFNRQRRLAISIISNNSPIGELIASGTPEQAAEFIKMLDNDRALMQKMLDNPELAKSPAIQEAYKKGPAELKKACEDAKAEKKKTKSDKTDTEPPKPEPEKPVETKNGKYKYKGEEFKFTESQINDEALKLGLDKDKAIESLCEKEWSTPREIAEKAGQKTYRYRGGEFKLTEAEYHGKTVAGIAEICDKKFAASIKITAERTVGGVKEYKIGGEWVRLSEDAASLEDAQHKFTEELKKMGKALKAPSRLIKYFNVFQKILGPAVAAGIIYHLETAEDKPKAVAETILGLGTFIAGAKATELAFGRFTNNPFGKFLIDMGGGILATLGLHETMQNIAEKYWPKFAGREQISSEITSLIEKGTGRSLALTTVRSASSGYVEKGLSKIGLKAVSSALNKKIESTAIKKIYEFAGRGFTRKIATCLGAKGVTMTGLILDDAIPGYGQTVGLMTDLLALGMAAWMAKDIYDLTILSGKAIKIKSEMDKRKDKPIENLEPATETDKKAIEAELSKRGKSSFEGMSNDEIMGIINSMPDVRLKITRKGVGGHEEYRFVKGEVWSTKITDEKGEEIELSDKELNQEIKLPPPQEFKDGKIDYNQPKEKLMVNYRVALMYIKSELGWTKMDFEIKNEKEIELKRLDTGKSFTIKREGSTWSVEEFKSGLTLFQAAAVANLLGKAEGILTKEHHKGGSERPFQLDGNNIDFDREWNPVDLRILSGDTGWAGFYGKIGLSPKDLTEILNDWYMTEYRYMMAA